MTTEESTIPLQDRVKRTEERRLGSIWLLIGLAIAAWVVPVGLMFVSGVSDRAIVALFAVAVAVSVIAALMMMAFKLHRLEEQYRQRERHMLQYIAEELRGLRADATKALRRSRHDDWVTWAEGLEAGINAVTSDPDSPPVVPIRSLPQQTNGHRSHH